MFRQDLRYAIRMLLANPGFTAVAVLSLALGIGANTAIFSLLNNVMMSTLPVRNPHELVILTNPNASGAGIGSQTGDRSLLTYEEFQQLQSDTKSFTALMASQSAIERMMARIAGGEPQEIATRMVSGSYFATLGVPATLGRTFTVDDDRVVGGAPYAVISHEFWQRRFGGRADAIGLRETGWLLGLGVVAGVGLAVAALRLIASRLYGLETTDPIAFVTAIVLLSIVAILATWLPARRASRVDPLVALRYE